MAEAIFKALARALDTATQVDPRAEDATRGEGDELVPGFGMEAAGHAGLGVVGHVALDGAEVRQAELEHLGPLPVLLEPAPAVAVQGEVEDQPGLEEG